MYEILRNAVEEYPEEHDRKLVLADYLEETDNLREAEFWRWMSRNSLRAYYSCAGKYYTWFDKGRPEQEYNYTSAFIKSNIYSRLNRHKYSYPHYQTRREAENDLMRVYNEL